MSRSHRLSPAPQRPARPSEIRIGFTSLHENLDTTTPCGRLVFHVFAALAEFIRERIVAGTREGLAAGLIGGAKEAVETAARKLDRYWVATAGRALAEIRDGRLYELYGHSSYSDYVAERWGMVRQHAYKLMRTVRVQRALPEAEVDWTVRQVDLLGSVAEPYDFRTSASCVWWQCLGPGTWVVGPRSCGSPAGCRGEGADGGSVPVAEEPR
ncbi:recombinase family protein [Planomonospora sp. ID67723]|uniref:recombinase family protein n=1 Tax=Planomonospora sp. ID67723 TaxID=2738134 RepID=UPI0035A99A2D